MKAGSRRIPGDQDEYSLTIRPLNSIDLAAAAGAADLKQAHDLLLQCCVVSELYILASL